MPTTMTAKTEHEARIETLSGFQDILEKCEASLMPAIEEHVTNEAFDSAKDGLDFLEVGCSLCGEGFLFFSFVADTLSIILGNE